MLQTKTSCVLLMLCLFSAHADGEASTCSSAAEGCTALTDETSLLQVQQHNALPKEAPSQLEETEGRGEEDEQDESEEVGEGEDEEEAEEAEEGGENEEELKDVGEVEEKTSKPVCDAITLAMSTYGTYGVSAPRGYKTANKYEKVTPGTDVDRAVWFTKGGKCWIVFMGSNSQEDAESNDKFHPIDKWGIKGLHSGIAFELEPLLNLIKQDFGKMRSSCSGLTVAGHSLGGALAQILAMAINKKGDPLGAGIKVDYLYTFGAMAVAHTKQGDDNRKDGCFAGSLYWYAMKGSVHKYAIDVVALHGIGGQSVHRPTRAMKKLVSGTGKKTKFPCGKNLPTADALSMQGSFAQWLTIHVNYRKWLGCTKKLIDPFSAGAFR